MVRMLTLVLGLCGLLGCGTIITKIDTTSPSACTGKPIPPLYSGTRLSLGCARNSDVAYVWVIDVPISFSADTAVLPISLAQVATTYVSERFSSKKKEVVLEPQATIAPAAP